MNRSIDPFGDQLTVWSVSLLLSDVNGKSNCVVDMNLQ